MLNIVFAGSPAIAVILLKGLIELKQVDIAAVLTNAPSPVGRSKTPVSTPVAQLAHENGLTVLEPEKLDTSVREKIAALKPDLLVCFAYGKIFGPKFLALFPKGGINLHPSLLPKHRGPAPVPAAILAGETKTGITVQRLAQRMDSGDILAQKEIVLDGTETAEEVLMHAAREGVPLVSDVLAQIESGTERAVAQNEEEASYCKVFCKADGLLDWTKSVASLCAQVRAFQPWPGTFTYAGNAKLYIHTASVYRGGCTFGEAAAGTVIGIDKDCGILVQTGDGVLAIQKLQKEAKKAMPWKDFLNGSRNFIGTQCSSSASSNVPSAQ